MKTTAGQAVRGSVTLPDISAPRVSGQIPFDRQYASKSDGTFSITEVPAGKYQICLGAPQVNLLDPCTWSAAPQVADSSKGTNVSGLTVVADTGFMLQVHVNDPDSMPPAPKGGSAGQTLSVTTTARNGRQVRFLLLKAASTGWDYCLPVPFDQTMTLDVKSSGVSLSDGNGQKYTANALSIPVRIPSGERGHRLRLTSGSPEEARSISTVLNFRDG